MEIIPIFAILGTFSMIVLVVYIVAHSRQRRVELQAEVQTRLIERFGSSGELVAFLESPAGRQFVGGVHGAAAMLTRERIMSGVTRSIVLTALGAAFLALTFTVDEDFAIPAAILFSLGVGYLIATVVSYKLAARLSPPDPMTGLPRAPEHQV